MTNSEVVDAFMKGIANKENHSLSTNHSGDKLFSYSTCIAQRIGSKVVINSTRYSNTTSKHQCLVRRTAGEYVLTTKYAERGTIDLKKFI